MAAGRRINVIGTSGSGKSTFARQLAHQLSVPYIEMDQLFWQPNWQQTPDEKFFLKIATEIAQDSWVLDGNYSRSQPLKWQKTQSIIWLDYSFTLTMYRAIKRALSRILTGKELWPNTGNKESFKMTFMSSDSILLWTLKSYFKNKKRYSKLMTDPQYQNIQFIRLTSPRMARQYIYLCKS